MPAGSAFRWWSAFSLGVIAGLILSIGLLTFPLEFDKKFDVAHVLELLVTLAVAFIVEHLLRERAGTDRAEKDLLIMNAKEVLAFSQSVRLAVRSAAEHAKITQPDFHQIVGSFRTLGMSLETLDATLQHAGSDRESVQRLKRTFSAYKDAVTGGSFPKDPIGPSSIAKYEALYQSFVRQLNHLILDINRE